MSAANTPGTQMNAHLSRNMNGDFLLVDECGVVTQIVATCESKLWYAILSFADDAVKAHDIVAHTATAAKQERVWECKQIVALADEMVSDSHRDAVLRQSKLLPAARERLIDALMQMLEPTNPPLILNREAEGSRTTQGVTMTEDKVSREMPRYKCHKEVWALKIRGILRDAEVARSEGRETDGSAWLTPVEAGYEAFKVDAAYMNKHKPEVGGYYVVYDDGYRSYSPAAPFESGYALVK